jgi:hypothetical protein
MAAVFSLSLHVVKLPDDTTPPGVTGAGVVYGLDMRSWESATAASAAQTAAYPGAATVINVIYFVGNQQYTGTYLVVETLATIQTAATLASPNCLQTVHIVQFTSGDAAPGSAGAGTAYIISNSFNTGPYGITAATATDIVNYPNALTRLNRTTSNNSQKNSGIMIVTEATAAVIAAS